MPQLDKYIFFNQIVSLTIFFSLIYIYIRSTVIPKMSGLLKYRKKKLELLNEQIAGYNKILDNSKFYNNTKGLDYTNIVSQNLTSINSYYQKKSSSQLANLYNEIINLKNENSILNLLILKNKIELKRIDLLSK